MVDIGLFHFRNFKLWKQDCSPPKKRITAIGHILRVALIVVGGDICKCPTLSPLRSLALQRLTGSNMDRNDHFFLKVCIYATLS